MATLPGNISGLSDAQKFDLIDALWQDLESHPPALSTGRAEELDRRIAAYEKPARRDAVGAGQGWAAQAVSLPVIWSDEAKAELYGAERWYADIGAPLAEHLRSAG